MIALVLAAALMVLIIAGALTTAGKDKQGSIVDPKNWTTG